MIKYCPNRGCAKTRSSNIRYRAPQRTILLFAALVLLAGCASETRDWDAARQRNTTASYQAFLRKHPNAQRSGEARERIELLDWQKTEAEATPEAFRRFLQEHPSGSHEKPAKTRLEALSWESAKKANTIQAFEAYLKDYPQGGFAAEARANAEALSPIRGKLSVLMGFEPLGGDAAFVLGSGSIVLPGLNGAFVLQAGAQQYQLKLSSETELIGVQKVGGGHRWNLGQFYEVNGRIERGSQVGGVGKTMRVARMRYAGK